MRKFYLFNPENDMALASGSPYYMAPASAKKMKADLAPLPAWYADAGSDVWVSDKRQVSWLASGDFTALSVNGVLEYSDVYDELLPWGWSPALMHQLGGSVSVEVNVGSIRALSSRRTAVDLLPLLRVKNTVGESSWLSSLEDVYTFAEKHGKVLLKAPWSGSGKGIQPLSGQPDDNLCGWIKRIIASQGGVVGEPYYNKVKDFAMEFMVSDEGVSFVGYSLFDTDIRGIYKENVLAADEVIEKELSFYVDLSVFQQIREKLLHRLRLVADDIYRGYLGVDMMIVQTSDGFAIHPCVEVNWRMNMGVVSRIFFNRYVCPEVTGRYVIEYYPNSGDALKSHEEMKANNPLCLDGGKIAEGYMSLTPVFEDTNYQIYVLMMKK